MDENIDFETYLFISSKKLIISVNTSLGEKVYHKEFYFNEDNKEINFDKLDFFLSENIFIIEKKLKNFINKALLILDSKDFFPIEISVKKKNYEKLISIQNLNYLLNEAKDYCKKTMDDKKIVHMIINNYKVDEKSFLFLPEGKRCNNFSIDIKFLCISNDFLKNFENILKKYQISLSQVVCADYIRNFLSKDEDDLFLMTKKLINGHNPNEVKLVDKTPKNEGFFEKFFNFFN